MSEIYFIDDELLNYENKIVKPKEYWHAIIHTKNGDNFTKTGDLNAIIASINEFKSDFKKDILNITINRC